MKLPLDMLTIIAWRNIWRNHRRTIVMLGAITVGVWAMIWMTALMRGMVDQMVQDTIMNLTGHIQIHRTGYLDDPTVNNSMPAPGKQLQSALADKNVLAWASRVRVPAVIMSERETLGITLVGIDPVAERNLSFIGRDLTVGNNLKSVDDPGIVLGRKLVERLETKLGRRIVVMSQDPDNSIADRGFRIVGIFDTDLEATELAYGFVGRATAQKMLKMGNRISELALITPDYRIFDDVLTKITAAVHTTDLDGSDENTLEVKTWQQLNVYVNTMLEVMDGFILVWFIVVFLAMSFGLVNTLLMAVLERTREIGLVQALGMSPIYIVVQVLIESLFLLSIGLVAGNVLAIITLLPFQGGIDISSVGEGLEWAGMSSTLYPIIEARDVVLSNTVIIVLGLIASLYPAWRAARHVPVVAISRR